MVASPGKLWVRISTGNLVPGSRKPAWGLVDWLISRKKFMNRPITMLACAKLPVPIISRLWPSWCCNLYSLGHTNLGQLDEAVVLLLAEVVEEVLVEASVLHVVRGDLQRGTAIDSDWQ